MSHLPPRPCCGAARDQECKPTCYTQTKHYTLAEWLAEGERRFGPNKLKWRFKCPACGHVQAVEDFQRYKSQGATAETARFNCIGRFQGAKRRAFGGVGEGPCDYTSGGLFDIRPTVVVSDDGQEHKSFEFSDGIQIGLIP